MRSASGLGTTQDVAIGAASAASAAFGAQTYQVRVVATSACRVRIGDGTQTALAADDLRRSLPAIRDSLEQLRDLARQLQEQPESVVYGPRPAAEKQ